MPESLSIVAGGAAAVVVLGVGVTALLAEPGPSHSPVAGPLVVVVPPVIDPAPPAGTAPGLGAPQDAPRAADDAAPGDLTGRADGTSGPGLGGAAPVPAAGPGTREAHGPGHGLARGRGPTVPTQRSGERSGERSGARSGQRSGQHDDAPSRRSERDDAPSRRSWHVGALSRGSEHDGDRSRAAGDETTWTPSWAWSSSLVRSAGDTAGAAGDTGPRPSARARWTAGGWPVAPQRPAQARTPAHDSHRPVAPAGLPAQGASAPAQEPVRSDVVPAGAHPERTAARDPRTSSSGTAPAARSAHPQAGSAPVAPAHAAPAHAAPVQVAPHPVAPPHVDAGHGTAAHAGPSTVGHANAAPERRPGSPHAAPAPARHANPAPAHPGHANPAPAHPGSPDAGPAHGAPDPRGAWAGHRGNPRPAPHGGTR